MQQDMNNYYYFLSISPDGERVAISFLPTQELSKAEDKKVELPNPSRCLVFRVDTEAGKISLENDKLKLEGKAAFLPNGYLALIGKRKIKVYDCKAGYKLVYWFNISSLFYHRVKNTSRDNRIFCDYTSLLHTKSSVNQHKKSDESLDQFPAEKYMQLSKLVEYDVFTTVYEGNIIRVWSPETGCRLISFKTPSLETPLALTKDRTFLATFSNSANTTNIYHVKTGLLVNTLQTQLANDLRDEHSVKHQVAYAEFHYKDTLLILIKTRQLAHTESSNAIITIEAWDLFTGKSIFQKKEEIRLDWKVKNSYVKPFIIETKTLHSAAYTALYTTMADDGSFLLKSMPLDVFKTRNPSSPNSNIKHNWIAKPFSYLFNQDSYNELNDNDSAAYFYLKEKPNILLRIGRHTVQLWRVSDINNQEELSESDALIFISTFKPPLHTSYKPFDYKWYKWDETLRKNLPAYFNRGKGDVNNVQRDEDVSGFDEEKWTEHGITFDSDNALRIKIFEPFNFHVANVEFLEIHLPLDGFSSNDYISTDYYFVESAINSLHYINLQLKEKNTENTRLLYNKTKDKVIKCVNQMIKSKSRYFTTISGSKSLVLLLMFSDGKEILFEIIQHEEIALRLFTYIHNGAKTVQKHIRADRNENALIVLIEQEDFALYELLLNRVILHAKELGAGCFTAITDALVFLESRGYTDVLRNSCRKLQFLNINPEVLPIVKDEILKSLSVKTLHKKLKMEFQDLKPSATNEQIPRYDNCWKDRFLYWSASCLYPLKVLLRGLSILTKILYAKYRHDDPDEFVAYLFSNPADESLIEFCIVPYVYFCSYDIYEEDVENERDNSNRDQKLPLLQRMVRALMEPLARLLATLPLKVLLVTLPPKALLFILPPDVLLAIIPPDSPLASTPHEAFLALIEEREATVEHNFLYKLANIMERLWTQLKTLDSQFPSGPVYKKKSALMKLALNQHENDLFSQEYTVLEALLYFKWKKKIKYRFFLICFIHTVYYVSFSVGVLFSREVFDYMPGMPIANNAKHMATVTLMLVLCGVLWIQEARQFYKMEFTCWKYFCSFYNYVDLLALMLPIVNLWQMLTSSPGLDELSAITTIILWLHGVLRLRAFAFIGVTVETIIQLIKSVYKTLLIMLLVLFAFTNAFIVLLARKDDAYFQEQYSGSIDLNNSGSSAESTVSYNDDSSSNNFKNPVKAFSTLWFFIYGVWDPINDGDAGDNYMIMVLAILFSFLTVLLFFNLVIALMSSRAEEVRALGKSVWLSHFAAEVEQLWCTRSERVSRNNNPSFVYYLAKKADIRRQADILEEESDELVQKLQARFEKREKMRSHK
ncbi:hypothetical protein G6F42_012337 [Rhizopus arrhizus]|nr:hypothetical protein G6F42_012337 [Rhizopus arrhizus]